MRVEVRSFNELMDPSERQQQALDAITARQLFILYGGAGGGGKSYWLRWALLGLLLSWAKQGHLGVEVGLFCKDYPTLSDRHLGKVRHEFPSWLGAYRHSAKEFRLARRFGAGKILFRNLDKTEKYKSAEFAAIAVDELTENPLRVFDDLRWRLRWPGIDYTPFLAGTNPGGVGHGWVKAYWIDGLLPPEMEVYRDSFAYIPAKATDNPHISPEYLKQLESLPEKLRKAVRDGDWDVFEGQAFMEWSREKHVVQPFEIPEWWTRFVSMDWGYTKPYALHWHAVNPDGQVITYRELYGWGGKPDEGSQEDAAVVARRVKDLEKGEKISYRVADPAIWAKTGHPGPTIAETFARERVVFSRADNDRIQGLAQVHHRLKGWNFGTEKWIPGWVIFSTCTHLIRTLPALVHDKRRVEDIDTETEDHAYDSIRYGLMSRPWAGTKPKQSAPDRYVKKKDLRGGEGGWMTV